ncbi:hypothetical protein HYC85_019231 [Camellia sinensis]|uniref:J domain-containing protein n=1 Tax=Camellia sinensis TaxID=4442 RepID=A0A7J7GL91_CAMSI|nr:hypothetical protein HYC85_019231 [Camellia sinensis]
MEGNKDEALRCVGIAKEAIASGNKQRALKFIGIARRLNHNLSVDDLLAACENLDSGSPGPSNDEKPVDSSKNEAASGKFAEVSNGEHNYTEEHVQLIREVRRSKDYYEILGLQKGCPVEEIRKAYRKLSLKVHPDKNKAPGAEEAFKKVSKAFKCLSNDDSRRQYDQTGLVEEFEYNQQYNGRQRRRRTGHEFFDDDVDPDQIFRAFFGQTEMFRASHVYRTRETANQPREEFGGAGPNVMLLLQILPFLIIFLLAYLPFSEPEYSLQKNYSYQFPKNCRGVNGAGTYQLPIVTSYKTLVSHEGRVRSSLDRIVDCRFSSFIGRGSSFVDSMAKEEHDDDVPGLETTHIGQGR